MHTLPSQLPAPPHTHLPIPAVHAVPLLPITLDQVPAPPPVAAAGYDHVQFTLVDCPGHASLIRTIIGGAQIMDVMLLVVDITKGIQTQTAECIVIGEIATSTMVVVLNKIGVCAGLGGLYHAVPHKMRHNLYRNAPASPLQH
jgi:translation initiation factor IF-2